MNLGIDIGFENQKQFITAVDFQFGLYGIWGKKLFELASCKPLPEYIGQWPSSIMPLIENLYKAQGLTLPRFEEISPLPPTTALKGNLAVVGFTGGKDSVCVACMLAEAGYGVHLLHLNGLNRAYYLEAENCKRLALTMGMPLTIRQVKVKGSSGDLSNRFRNQFILCQQLDFALEIGATAVSQGNHQADHLGNVTEWIWFADARENYSAFQAAFVGQIEYRTGLCVNPSMVFATIAKLRPDLFINIGSCVHPHRYMKIRRKQTKEKWGVEPLPGRCGICYKCCWEYLMLGEITDLIKLNREYAMNCLDVILANWHFFYRKEIRPANRLELVKKIIDEAYTPCPNLMRWVNEDSSA